MEASNQCTAIIGALSGLQRVNCGERSIAHSQSSRIERSIQCPIEMNIIPHTLDHTTLGKLKAGDHVNLEVDLIARYVARMLGKDSS